MTGASTMYGSALRNKSWASSRSPSIDRAVPRATVA
jgi:hypothetical protein